LKNIIYVFIAIFSNLILGESAAYWWKYVMRLSPFQAFTIVAGVDLCMLMLFWLPLYNKLFTKVEKLQDKHRILRWIAQKHNYFEKNKNKNIVKKIRAYGHLGLFFGGLIPFLVHPAICAHKIFIQTKFGPIFIWLGGTTRLAISVFCGFKLLDLLF